MSDPARPLYLIGVVADMLKVHPQTLRLYERKGLVRPSRSVGRTRLYSAEDVEEIQRVLRLTRDLGVNLAGVEIILKMRRQLAALEAERDELAREGRREPSAAEASKGAPAGLVRVAEQRLRRLDAI